MASAAMFDSAVAAFARGDVDWESDDVRVMLVTDDWSPSQASDATGADLRRFEVEPEGSYRSGGGPLRGRSVDDGFPGETRLSAGGVDWTGFTGQFRYAVVVQANGSPATDRTRYGATTSAYAFNATTAGHKEAKAGTDSVYTFGATTAGTATHYASTASTWTFQATTAGDVPEKYGATSSTWTFNATTAGAIEGAEPDTPTVTYGPKRLLPPEGKPLHLTAAVANVHIRAHTPKLDIGYVTVAATISSRAHAGTPTLTLTAGAANVITYHRAERDLQSLDLDRELAILLEA